MTTRQHRPSLQPSLQQQVARFRLQRHHLAQATACDPVTIARSVCGMQAQVMTAAFLQIWARNHSVSRNEIEAALWQKRSLIKTSLMRQTLHLVPADEFPTYIAALRSSRVAAVLRIMAKFKISPEESGDLTSLIVDSLCAGPRGGAAIRAAVRPKVSKRVRSWMDRVWSIVRIPVSEGLICYGPGENNETTFICVDQWLGRPMPAVPEEQARSALLRGYLRTYGPATLTDFCHWSGMPAGEVRPLPGLLADELAEVEIEKTKCLLLREDLEALRQLKPEKSYVRLLPHFDPYLLAHRKKDHLVETRHYKRVYRNQGWISPVVLVEGSVAGVWAYERKSKKLDVTIEPFGKLSRAERFAIAQEAKEIAAFLDCAVEVTIR
jgi:hypothetical protein